MTTITLTNGQTFSCLGVHGASKIYQGTTRDTLTFMFTPETDLASLMEAFTPENTASISIDTDGNVSVHEHYQIRVGAGISLRDIVLSMPIKSDENVAWVSMARSTFEERALLNQQETLDALVVTVLEGGNI